jgi:hypothetical protein
VVLVIPDFYHRAYVRDFLNILLVTMGFKQVCAQQESVIVSAQSHVSITITLSRNHWPLHMVLEFQTHVLLILVHLQPASLVSMKGSSLLTPGNFGVSVNLHC